MSASSSNVPMFLHQSARTKPCGWCGVLTRSKGRVCPTCLSHERIDSRPNPEYALTDGEWVPVDGILRWVAA